MQLMRSVVVLWLSLTTSGELDSLKDSLPLVELPANDTMHRLLDKIAKDIMVCENKTIKRWDGTIGEYKNHLRKKMVTMGQV